MKKSNDEIVVSNVQVLAVKSVNYPAIQLAIYKNNKKIFYSDCLWEFNLCDFENFYKKTNIKKIVAVRQTNSNIIIKEIYFWDGRDGYNLNSQDVSNKLYNDFRQALKSILIFLLSSIFFFMLGIFFKPRS
ncbi:hypothetical protein [Kingella potus]|uniref:hypothetical protein n=1 Tax=Kingella potus TaxID=265175 RepID=UPI001FD48B2B|nr:hypothetical protein [Kingella potus]UOP01417.1 hypothetical protein LVJ84_04170 [Kingella potus]